MRRFVIALLSLLLLVMPSYAWEGKGTFLDQASLPEGWQLEVAFLASNRERESFSEQLGVKIELLRNYAINTPEGQIGVNFVVTETSAQAETLYDMFLQMKSEDMLVLNGNRLLEVVTQNDALVELARDQLVFIPEEEGNRGFAALESYVHNFGVPVRDGLDIAELIRPHVEEFSIFLFGESHGVGVNQQLEFDLLEFFVKQAGVGTYLLELSPSVIGLLNEFLRSGDQQLLEETFASLQGTYFWTKEMFQHWVSVKELWDSLPENERFTLVGIDIEHNPRSTFHYLDMLLRDTIPHSSSLSQIGPLYKGEKAISNEDLVSLISTVVTELENNEEEYCSLLGESYDEVVHVVTNLDYSLSIAPLSSSDRSTWNDLRDQAMYDNFQALMDTTGKEKYFGQWGLNHVFLGEQGGVEWIASRINNGETPYRNKVLSTAFVYSDSEFFHGRTGTVGLLNNYMPTGNILLEVAKEGMYFVSLVGHGSPFERELIWKVRGIAPEEGVITDYFQYLLFIPGAKASRPFE